MRPAHEESRQHGVSTIGWLKSLAPCATAPLLVDVNIEGLKAEGIQGIILDLDNTITPWRSLDVGDAVLDWLRRAREAGLRLCIVSNSSKARRVAELSKQLDIPAWAQVGGKPFGAGCDQGLAMLETPPEATAVIGDQIFSDVLGGNRHGLYTVFVEPMSRSEFIATKVIRVVERLVLWLLRRRGMFPAQVAEDGVAESGQTSTQKEPPE